MAKRSLAIGIVAACTISAATLAAATHLDLRSVAGGLGKWRGWDAWGNWSGDRVAKKPVIISARDSVINSGIPGDLKKLLAMNKAIDAARQYSIPSVAATVESMQGALVGQAQPPFNAHARALFTSDLLADSNPGESVAQTGDSLPLPDLDDPFLVSGLTVGVNSTPTPDDHASANLIPTPGITPLLFAALAAGVGHRRRSPASPFRG